MGMGSVRMNTPAPVSVTESSHHSKVGVTLLCLYLDIQPRMDMTNLDQLKLENCLDF